MSKPSERGHLNFDCNALKMSAEFAVSFKKNTSPGYHLKYDIEVSTFRTSYEIQFLLSSVSKKKVFP